MDLDSFLVSLYVLVDDWWRADHRQSPRRAPGRPILLSVSEVLTLAILAQWPRFRSERDFWRFAHSHLCVPTSPPSLLPEPAQPAHSCSGARIACLAAGPCPAAMRAFCRLPRDGHDPRSGHRASEGVSRGAFLWAGELRKMPLQDRVGLWVQGRVGGGPRRGGHGFRLGPSQPRRAADRGGFDSFRAPRRLPGRPTRGSPRWCGSVTGWRSAGSFGRRYTQGQLPSVVVGDGSALGGRQAAGHRAGHLPVE